ncbi:D-alanine--D-alanine ligase [Larsenimonas suaedae]|uniref:D-alanine--D-alanine ligase n=1 Tax=Larsenimonas suaedae TaxID=1851019 RepID=A0ABU1GV91_9GAMM|nr:D-alanine--D-alanine ligase [Larsenimonas suaedae]MCM2971041.1 D-alanine--D-alanine ligase [Larsenimonas suaedae]MDR5895750.1 D-alanine--D-alanine ligase [Larsenimonas suaedae]
MTDDVNRFGRVVVLYGGTSSEREVSLMSGKAVLASLEAQGVDVIGYDFAEGLPGLMALEPDRVFIALHGRGGEDGTLQGALELLGIPYTGSKVMASALGMDKMRTKRVWAAEGLPTPLSERLTLDTDWRALSERIGLPMVIKPVNEGSTLGLTIVRDESALKAAFEASLKFDHEVMAERFIEGEEYTVAVLDGQALPAIRVVAPGGFYDYEAKYFSDETRYLLPCGLDADAEQRLSTLSVQAFESIGCEGWGRVDVMRDHDGGFWLLEVNTSPGMTGHSLVPQAAHHVGIDFNALVCRVLATTLTSEA